MTEFVDSLPLCFQRNKLLSDGSDCEESDCSAGDSGLIPGLERSLGVGNGNLLPDSCWKTPWTEEPGGLQSWSFKESDMTEWLTFSLSLSLCFQRDELFGKLLPVFSCIVFDFMKQLQNDKSGNRFFFFFLRASGVQMLLQPSRCFKESGFLFFSFAIFSSDFYPCVFKLSAYTC